MTTSFSSSPLRRHLYVVPPPLHEPERQEPAEPQVHPLLIARIEREITQQELADQTGICTKTISRAEHGYGVNTSTRHLLCDFFGKTAQELGLRRHIRGEERFLQLLRSQKEA